MKFALPFLALVTSPLFAATDIFLKIEGIPGESTDALHKDWIAVLEYSLPLPPTGGAALAPAQVTKALGAAAKLLGKGKEPAAPAEKEIGQITLKKLVDAATPRLAGRALTGEKISEVSIEVCRAAGDKSVIVKYTLKNVIVASTTTEASSREEVSLKEHLTLNFAQIDIEYIPVDAAGKPKESVKFSYDFTAGKGK
jgi:type VI secretion system secreted protein Hcp